MILSSFDRKSNVYRATTCKWITKKIHLMFILMDQVIRKIQLVAVAFILVATALAFLMEINKMYENKSVELADLLLLFIYIEVIGMIRLFWESKSIRITYPLLIAITALSRFIILQGKGMDPINLIYEASAILLIAIAILLLRLRKSKLLGLDKSKEGEDS